MDRGTDRRPSNQILWQKDKANCDQKLWYESSVGARATLPLATEIPAVKTQVADWITIGKTNNDCGGYKGGWINIDDS